MTISKKWNWEKLGDAVQVLDNLRKPINSSERQKRIANKSTNELFPYYGATGQVGWIDNFITSGEYVLVGEDGAPFLDNFKEKAYKIKGKTWVNNHAHILKQKEGITINDFILHYLNSINYRQYVNGTTRLKLTKGSLVEIPFPVPSIDTQQAIVSKIEELFSEIENGIKSLFTAKEQLKTYRQSVLKWAFEGKLTKENVKEGELPEGWKWVKLKDIMEKIRSGSAVPPSNELSDYPMLRSSSVRNGKINFKDVKYIHTADKIKADDFVTEGDLLFTRLNGSIDYVGNCAKVTQLFPNNLIYPDRLFRLRLLKPKHADYIMYFFSTNLVRKVIENKAKSTAGHMRISIPDITDMMIPLSPDDENKTIVQAIESRLSVADKMEESITQSLQQAEALKQSILKKAFGGELK